MKLLDFPGLKQTYEYDCGVKALQAILTYYGIETSEELLMKYAKTNKKVGTSINGILQVLKKYNLQFDSRIMTLKNLKDYIKKKIPVMILLQAWNSKPIKYANDYQDGHWVVAIGYNNKQIFFEDPYTFERTFLKNDELKDRWHAKENNEKIINHGIAVYGKDPVYNSKKIIHMD